MPFDPKTKKYPYPMDTSSHYIKINKKYDLEFDRNYPYIDNSKGFKFKRFWVRFLLNLIVFPISRLKLGLKIEGKKNLKKHKELIKNGVISVSNHIHYWDYISIMKAVRPIKPYTLVWAENIRGDSGNLVRLCGGIPIPDKSFGGKVAFNKAIKNILNDSWLHIYPEGSMWEYYMPIRPFKMGAFTIAVNNDKPIIPMAFSYRKCGLIGKMFHLPARLTLRIGEPIFKNDKLSLNEQKLDLLNRCHSEVCKLASINPSDNIYEALYNDSKRKDYY